MATEARLRAHETVETMKPLWLRDSRLQVLFENEEIIAVDKPYGFDTHTNESKTGQADFIQPGLIELFEKHLARALHIVHRLDRTTSGVIVFAKTPEAAQLYQGFFRARETKKTYLFVTASRSKTAQATCAQPIVRNGAELDASTDFELIERNGAGFELWRARPHTGRNHQIRIHAAHVGTPLLGDVKYGGAPFAFICLHNEKIEFPNGVAITSKRPRFFDDLSLLKDRVLSQALIEIERRERLFQINAADPVSPHETTVRWIHTERESPDRGLSLDRLGENDVLSFYQETVPTASYQALQKILRRPLVIRFLNPSTKRAPEVIGRDALPEKWTVRDESGLHEIHLPAIGLYLEQTLQRRWVLENAKGLSVLNLFASTCGFSVAAALGGAKDVVSVDSSKAMLNWGRENFALNGLEPSTTTFLCRDALQFMEQSVGKKTFDLVICDPPAFSRGEKGVFKIEQNLEALLRQTLAMGRQVLFSTHADSLFSDDIRKAIVKASKHLEKTVEISHLQPSLDFESPGQKIALKSFLIQS